MDENNEELWHRVVKGGKSMDATEFGSKIANVSYKQLPSPDGVKVNRQMDKSLKRKLSIACGYNDNEIDMAYASRKKT